MPDTDGPPEALAVRHEPERSRFVVDIPGGQAELLYGEFGDGILDLQHTEVPPAGRGKGVSDALVRAALGFAREQGARVMATCPYVQAWLRRHPGERPG
jgi:predicted GNAT family acetyltransferase